MKQVLKVQPYLSKLVVDFIREAGKNGEERNAFLQLKYAEADEFVAQLVMKSGRPPKVTQEMTRCQTDFILNTRPLISSLDGGQKRVGGGQLATEDQSTRLASSNLKGQPVEVRCAGDYCNIEDMMGDKDDIPDYHYERLTQMSNDNEKKGTIHAVNLRSFGPEAETVLPDSDSMSYKVPNMIILIDQDIKSLWQEQTVIKNRLEKIRSLNNGVIEKIYQEYQDSLAGKKFQHSSAQTRYQMKDVCHQCYRFYLALFKEVVTPNGRIKNDALHRLSDPLYQLGEDKAKKFDEISRDIRKSFQRKAVDVL